MTWLDEYAEGRKAIGFNRPLKVFYGYAKLTPKIVRKRQLVAYNVSREPVGQQQIIFY